MSSEKKISRRNMIAASVVGGAIAGYAIAVPTLPMITQPKAAAETIEYNLCYVGDFSDGLINESTEAKNIIEIAVEDYNRHMESTGENVRFVAKTADSKCTTEGALAAIQTAHETLGVNAVCADWTVAISGLKTYADENSILVTSGTSTGINLAIPNDSIFRIQVPDTAYVASLGDAIYGLGIKSHLIVAPNDAHYGILGGLLKDALIAKGVTADLMLIAPTQVDYASDVAAAGRKASDMGAVSIMLLSDSDPTLINFETHAMRDPVLSTLKWWGTDQIGHTSMYPPAASEEIAKFLKERGWMGATIPDPKGSQADEVVKKYGDRTSGAKPWMYMVSDYDAAWLTMEAMKQCKNDGPRMIATFPEICKRYSGVTGPTLLDKNGDLIASSVQYIRINDSLTGMEAIGTYNMQLGGVITYTKTPPSYDYETHTVINQ